MPVPDKKVPRYSDVIRAIAKRPNAFCLSTQHTPNQRMIKVPAIFSLIDNYTDSMAFLKILFSLLYSDTRRRITIDFRNCKVIEPDASAVMDALIRQFVNYNRATRKTDYPSKLTIIDCIYFKNYRQHIKDFLFVAGTLRYFGQFRRPAVHNVKPLTLIERKLFVPRDVRTKNRDADTNAIISYVANCLETVGQRLHMKNRTRLWDAISELLVNAEDHNTTSRRYTIGYFTPPLYSEGVAIPQFRLCIFNFGDTIYERFQNGSCRNLEDQKRLKERSAYFEEKGFFENGTADEQTLWTLGALQGGVSSLAPERGSGTMSTIESFFNLRRNPENDTFSKLMFLSGNSRILVDGSYPIIEKLNDLGYARQEITFNKSGRLDTPYDNKFVTFADHFFPGTLISTRIAI